jgi:hypothetical protein
VNILFFGQFNPLCHSPHPFPPTAHYSVAFSPNHYVLYLHRCVFNIIDALLFPFPFPLLPTSIA